MPPFLFLDNISEMIIMICIAQQKYLDSQRKKKVTIIKEMLRLDPRVDTIQLIKYSVYDLQSLLCRMKE